MVKYIKLVLQAACAKIYASLIFSQNGNIQFIGIWWKVVRENFLHSSIYFQSNQLIHGSCGNPVDIYIYIIFYESSGPTCRKL